MILIRMLGGLGNQMFQYAYAKELAYRFGDEIFIDLGAYKNYRVRGFGLEELSIQNLKYVSNDIIHSRYYKKIRLAQKAYHVMQKGIVKVRGDDLIGQNVFEAWANRGYYFNFDPYYYEPVKPKNENKIVYGYFQGESHFVHVIKEIKDEFRVSLPESATEKELLTRINDGYAVGVSIRCGHGYRGTLLDVCKKEYYYAGMDRIAKVFPKANFYIFSDDIEHVRTQYKFRYPVTYIEGLEAAESLRLLASCDGFVIANSTFSWWGAYLSRSDRKVTVAPQIWYKKAYSVPDVYSCGFDILL